jgi:transcription termination factor Rho
MALRDEHLADLHGRAQELGVPGFRMLPRDELIAAIEGAESEDSPDSGTPRAREREGEGGGGRRRGRRGGRGRRRRAEPRDDERKPEEAEGEEPRGRRRHPNREAEEDRETDKEDRESRHDDAEGAETEDPETEDVETEDIVGVLDRMPQGYGFLRLSGLGANEGDVYVSASQIRRCELRPGDEVAGPARAPRRGERHRALVRVDSVNGQEPEGERVQFEDLTAVAPTRRLDLGEGEPLARAVDLLAPLAFGQRVLILAEPRSGRSTLLRAVGRTLTGGGAQVRVLLADERPEEVTEWERALPDAEIVAATADQEPADQVRAAELAMGHAKRRAESGEDVVVIIDSLSRLALGYRDPARVKRIFGAGRELAEDGSGSLTVIATVLDSDERGKEVRDALETTENSLLRLDAGLASDGIVPSLLIAECRVSGEEELRSPEELEAVRALRSELSEMDPADAAKALGERIDSTKSNEELLKR